MKICLISNIAPHYRKEIYTLIDKHLQCDFVFGDTLNNGINTLNLSRFNNKVTILRNMQRGEVTIWQRGVLSEIFKKYDAFIVADDIRCLSTWILLFFSKILKKNVYFWAHGWYGKEGGIKKLVKKWFYHFPNGIFLYGNYSRQIMIQNGFVPDKLWVIHNSLAYSKQLSIRKGLSRSDIFLKHFNNNDPNLIFIGRLTSVKRLDMVLNAMKLLKDRGIKCNLTIVGTGPEQRDLIHLSEVLGLMEKVWYYGACYNENINAELIYNADLCVSPGNIGLTAMHVMVFGTPAITHNCFQYQMPEFEAIKPCVTGDFYEYGNVISLADTIEAWLKEKNDKREDVRQACFNEIDSYWTPEYQLNVIREHIQ